MRQDGDGFQPDGEGPEDFARCVLVGQGDGQEEGAPEQVLDAEGVEVRVVGGLVAGCHEVDCVGGGGEEEELEDGVVCAVREGPEEV